MTDFLTDALFGEWSSGSITPYGMNVSTFMAGPQGEKGDPGPQGPPGEKVVQTLELEDGKLKISDGNSVQLPNLQDPIQEARDTYTLSDAVVQGVYARTQPSHPSNVVWAEGEAPTDYPALLIFVKAGSLYMGYASKAANVTFDQAQRPPYVAPTPRPNPSPAQPPAPSPVQPQPKPPVTPAPVTPAPTQPPAPSPAQPPAPSPATPVQLVAPTLSHSFEGNTIIVTWPNVPGATSYEVSVNGSAPTAATSPHRATITLGESGTVKVRSIAGANKSDFAVLDYDAPSKQITWETLKFTPVNGRINLNGSGDYIFISAINSKVVTPAGGNSTFGMYVYPDATDPTKLHFVNEAVEGNYPTYSAIPDGSPAKTKLSEENRTITGARSSAPVLKNVGDVAEVTWSGEMPIAGNYKDLQQKAVGVNVMISERHYIGIQRKDANTYQAATTVPLPAEVPLGQVFPANLTGTRYSVPAKAGDKAIRFEYDEDAIKAYIVRADDSKDMVVSAFSTPSGQFKTTDASFGRVQIIGYEFDTAVIKKGH